VGFPEGVSFHRLPLRIAGSVKSTVLICFHVGKWGGEQHTEITELITLSCQLARTRLLAALRHSLGGVYSVSVEFGQRSLAEYGLVTVGFDCDPQNVNRLVEATVAELHALGSTSSSTTPTSSIASSGTTTSTTTTATTTGTTGVPSDSGSGGSSTDSTTTAGSGNTAVCVQEGRHEQEGAQEAVTEAVTLDEAMSLSEMGLATHTQALQNDSSWLFWLLDSYKHRRLHEAHKARQQAQQQEGHDAQVHADAAPASSADVMEERASWVEQKVGSRTQGRLHRLQELAAPALALVASPPPATAATAISEIEAQSILQGPMREQMQSVLRRIFDKNRHVVIAMVPKGGAGSDSSL
jgi:hypothetical protein